METEIEIFKDVPGYEGIYQISSLGSVKSLGNSKTKKEKILKASTNSRGYKTVALQSKTFQVHQLVAMAFLDHVLCGYKKVIDHINNNPLDNRVENLKITSQRENLAKKFNTISGVKKSGNFWNVHLTFCSFKTEEEAANFRKKLLDIGNKMIDK